MAENGSSMNITIDLPCETINQIVRSEMEFVAETMTKHARREPDWERIVNAAKCIHEFYSVPK